MDLNRDSTFLFQKHSTFGNNDRHISINETLSSLVHERNGNVCVFDAVLERDSEDSSRCFYFIIKDVSIPEMLTKPNNKHQIEGLEMHQQITSV